MTENITRNLIPFFSGLTAMIENAKKVQEVYNPIVAFEFNSFNFWRPGENKVSEILAFFLDPRASHGQGNIFLGKFIKCIGMNNVVQQKLLKLLENNEPVQVYCEYGISSGRRIDILIIFGNDKYALAIENKLWAKDQDQQLYDYHEFLIKRFKGEQCLLYLTPYSKEPTEISLSKKYLIELLEQEYLRLIGYEEHIIDCVKEWSLHCRAERVRSFLLDFEQYLKQEITGEKFMNEHQIISSYILNSCQNIEAAVKVYRAFDEIKVEVLRKFLGLLTEELSKRLPDYEVKSLSEKAFNIEIKNQRWSNRVIFGIKDFDADRVHFSVKAEMPAAQNLYSFLKEELKGRFNEYNWWHDLKDPYNKWDKDVESIVAFSQGKPNEALIYMVDNLVKISECIEKFLVNVELINS